MPACAPVVKCHRSTLFLPQWAAHSCRGHNLVGKAACLSFVKGLHEAHCSSTRGAPHMTSNANLTNAGLKAQTALVTRRHPVQPTKRGILCGTQECVPRTSAHSSRCSAQGTPGRHHPPALSWWSGYHSVCWMHASSLREEHSLLDFYWHRRPSSASGPPRSNSCAGSGLLAACCSRWCPCLQAPLPAAALAAVAALSPAAQAPWPALLLGTVCTLSASPLAASAGPPPAASDSQQWNPPLAVRRRLMAGWKGSPSLLLHPPFPTVPPWPRGQ